MTSSSGIPFSWWERSKLTLIMQSEAAECALACLGMIARYHGFETDLPALRRRFSSSLKGMTLTRVIDIAQQLGFEARPLRAELEYLPQAQFPCVMHWDMNHFVVLNRVTRKGLEIFDPARGRLIISLSEASKHFTGVLLELAPGADFSPRKARQGISLRALTGSVSGLRRTLVQIVGLALIIELLALVVPFQIRWMLDRVLPADDKSLLLITTIGFLVVMSLQTTLTIARGWILSWIGATLNVQWSTNLFSHLLKLPLDFFEKRHMGDIVSRLSSVQWIEVTLSGSFVEAVLDGLMGVLTLAILLAYSATLTACVLAAFCAYVVLRLLTYRVLWRTNEEQLVYSAKQQSELMESVRGIQAIKLANRQSQRKARFSNAAWESARRSMRSQRITLCFGAINQGLFGIQRIVLVSLGTYLAIKQQFSAGMVLAYIAYADQFTTKVGNLVDRAVDLCMLRLHVERIGDIALAEPEKHSYAIYSGPEPEPQIEISDLSFRYSEAEPWVLRHLNLTIKPGESVAITGPSGCGKSTLAKLMLGLLEPTEGCIRIGGIDIKNYGYQSYHNLIAAVMQDDSLFAGSIAENIAFFAESSSMDEVMAAAKMAGLHDDIMAMPMAYESLVGDMGSALSGGQKQRVVLARALFRRPKVLLLDEATSHLDAANESAINRSVRHLDMTRVIIAHRQETIASADRVYELGSIAPARKQAAEAIRARANDEVTG
jgi:ATP-binding cassette, subfamily B, bacterial CvaB/MchF/RaxB